MNWSIQGLQPGMLRGNVLQLRGEPLGDGGFGKVVNQIPPGSATDWDGAPVWHYGEVAVVFREDVVVQVLGCPLELNGQPFWPVGSEQDGGLDELWECDSEGRLDLVNLVDDSLAFRLRPPLTLEPLPESTPLLRNRLRESLEGLEGSRALSFDLECRGAQDLSVCEDWVEGTGQGLRWKPLALRRSLWECLHYGHHYWRAGGRRRLEGHIISTNSWNAEPVHVRLRLLVDSEIRLAQRRGTSLPSKVALDEMDERECAAAWQRLMLLGCSPEPGFWRGFGGGHAAVRLLDGNQATESLRWAAALARLIDERRASHPFLYPGPPNGNYEIGLALAGRTGKSGWSWKGAAAPDVYLDWNDPRHRFHAHWTPAGAVLKAFDRDRLGEILEIMGELQRAGNFKRCNWDPWGDSLPMNDKERELLREIERAPHFDRPVHHLATGLRRIAALAREWLPASPSQDQRMLAEGLALVLESGLQVLGVPAAAPAGQVSESVPRTD